MAQILAVLFLDLVRRLYGDHPRRNYLQGFEPLRGASHSGQIGVGNHDNVCLVNTVRPLIFYALVVRVLGPITAIPLCFLVLTQGDIVLGQQEDISEKVIKLRRDLKDEDATVRRSAADALGQIGPAAVATLIEALKDEDVVVRYLAAVALGRIGPEAKAAVPALIEALKDEDANVRRSAAVALGQIGPAAVATLIEALKDEDVVVHYLAAVALGRIGPEAKAAVPALIEALKDEDANVRHSTVYTLVQISVGLQDAMTNMPKAELEKAVSLLAPFESHPDVPEIRRAAMALRAELGSRFWYRAQQSTEKAVLYFTTHKSLWLVATYVGLILVCCVGLVVWPSGLLVANDFLRKLGVEKVKVTWPFEVTISLRQLLVVGIFNYYKPVLDAWVRRHLEVARKRFREMPTVEQMEVHVNLPVLCKGLDADFSQTLQETFGRMERTCVVIKGEGGSGKTSLACQVGKWAIHEDKRFRLTRHPMLPILIEDEVGENGFIEKVREELQSLIRDASPDSELFMNLLRKKKIVVIVDHFSEMSVATRRQIRPKEPEFPVAALVFTSRSVDNQLGNPTMLETIPLSGNRLSSFMEAYLAQSGKPDSFENNQQEYFRGCERLSGMVGDRKITPLVAKFYINQLVKSIEEHGKETLPENIPDLMLRYLDERHEHADLHVKQRTQADAKEVAWLCVEDTFQPEAADREKVLKKLGDDAVQRLAYLESTLRIVRTEGTSHDKVSFILHPLAEYLAGLKVVQMHEGDENLWTSFLNRAGEKPSVEAITGFLLAVRDCCRATKDTIIESVPEEIAKLCGLEMPDSGQIILERACQSHGQRRDHICAGDFAKIEDLDLSVTGVNTIDLLAKFTDLKMLELIGCKDVSDLTPLSTLTRLRLLELVDTRISDLTPLTRLKCLISLNVNGTKVSDLEPLADLPKLAYLHVMDTNVKDIAALGGLKNLSRLNLQKTQVDDIKVLIQLAKEFHKLQWVNLKDTNISADEIKKLRGHLPDGFVLG